MVTLLLGHIGMRIPIFFEIYWPLKSESRTSWIWSLKFLAFHWLQFRLSKKAERKWQNLPLWRLLDKIQLILSYFCCLFKKPELYKRWYWSEFFPLFFLRSLKYVCIKIQTLISNSQDTLKYVLGTTNFSL